MQPEANGEDCSAAAAAAAQRRHLIYSRIPSEWLIDAEIFQHAAPVDVPELSGALTPKELDITEARAVDLAEAIAKRAYTAVEVTVAFCKRATIAHQLANCLAEVLFDQALQRANELDGYLLRFGRTVGPLHGLPISVKEHIYLKGTTATSGLVAWADNMCDDDALIISQLKDAGAVFHVKTTNPQALMSLETRSNLFGRALNPYNTNLTSGGSSGGEAALLAMHGASMGIGTDIGGSIRVPSAFCGIVGFKPSVGRTPHGGLSGLHQGMKNIIGVVGPMARCLEDVELFMAAAIANDPALKEPGMIEKAWTGASSNAAIRRVAIMWDDGMVHPHPPITQALQRVRTALQKPGIEVVDWQADLHEPIFHLVTQLYFQDGGEEYHQVLRQGNESAVPLLEKLLGACGPALTVKQSWKLSLFSPLINAELDRLRTLYAQRWNDARIDCVICPAAPSLASNHDETLHWGYSCVWNALDHPAVVLPIGQLGAADASERSVAPSDEPFNDLDAWYAERWHPDRYTNAPVAIQIVGRKLQEERLLGITAVIDRLLQPERESIASRPVPVGGQQGTYGGVRASSQAQLHSSL